MPSIGRVVGFLYLLVVLPMKIHLLLLSRGLVSGGLTSKGYYVPCPVAYTSVVVRVSWINLF